jgi:hypothetical protein
VWRAYIRVSWACVVEVVGVATQAILNGRVRLSRTGQGHFDQPNGFPKRVPGPQFSPQARKFGRRTVREQPGKWGLRPRFRDPSRMAQAASKPWPLYLNSPEKRVENTASIIMERALFGTAIVFPANLYCCTDLILRSRFLQVPQQGLCVAEEKAQILVAEPVRRAAKSTDIASLGFSIVERRLDKMLTSMVRPALFRNLALARRPRGCAHSPASFRET